MADAGLLRSLGHGQYKLTLAGQTALDQFDMPVAEKVANSATDIVRKAEANYLRPLVIAVAGAFVAALAIWWVGL